VNSIHSFIPYTVCPTRYRTRHFFNNFTTNEDIAKTTDTFRFISHTTNVLLFKFRCNIFIDVRIIKEMPGSVASGTPYIINLLSLAISLPKFCMQVSLPQRVQYFLSHITLFYLSALITKRPQTACLGSCCQWQSDTSQLISIKWQD